MNADKDYPAAHSMDTEFYMIDECGHVAACWSSESGAVPKDAVTEIATYDPESAQGNENWDASQHHAIRTMDPDHAHWLRNEFAGRHVDADARFWYGSIHILENVPPKALEKIQKILKMPPSTKEHPPLLHTIEGSRRQLELFGGKLAAGKSGVGEGNLTFLLIHDRSYLALLGYLHIEELCATCTSVSRLSITRFPKGDPVFQYAHPSPNCEAYPYHLCYVPAPSLLKKCSELGLEPDEVERLHERAQISGCFKDRKFFQPAELFKCEIYDNTPVVKMGSKRFKELSNSSLYW